MESRNLEHRRDGYKNKGNFKQDELRRRREEQQVEIRRQKREENVAKRRNLTIAPGDDSDDDAPNSGAYDLDVSLVTANLDLALTVRADSTDGPRRLLGRSRTTAREYFEIQEAVVKRKEPAH